MENGNYTIGDRIARAECPVAQPRTDHMARWVAVVIGEHTVLAWWTMPLRQQTGCWPGAAVCQPPNWSDSIPRGSDEDPAFQREG